MSTEQMTVTSTNGHAGRQRMFTRAEVADTSERKLLIISNKVYDITRFTKTHPGGARIISHFAGQDATDAWIAFHNRKEYVSKYMKPLLVGEVQDPVKDELTEDFRELRKQAESMGLFKAQPLFYVAHLVSIFVCAALSYYCLKVDPSSWTLYLAAALLMTVAQAQGGWSQHDYGHLSVFHSNFANHFVHQIIIGVMKGASSHWWNFRHFQHHAKPNVIRKDPDINLAYIFMLGKRLPIEWGKRKRGFMPYNWQQDYFFLLGPPLLLPVYFHVEIVFFVLKRRDWVDFTTISLFFVWWFTLFNPILGSSWASFWFYMCVRFFESHWFVWCTQMSHIPMKIDLESRETPPNWVTLQLESTTNADPSFFNDWFTGHLNYQIEHHLFPTMPRHNFCHIRPLVMSLCKKHNIPYTTCPLLECFGNLVKSLKNSGELWWEAYHS